MRTYESAVDDLSAVQAGAFTGRQARAHGATHESVRWQTTTGRWQRRARDVFVKAGTPDTWLQRLWIAHLEAGPRSVVSHAAAAQLHGLPGFDRNVVEVTKRETWSNRCRAARRHETALLPSDHVTTVDGLPVTSVARTVFDLAGCVTVPWSRNPEVREHQIEIQAAKIGRLLDTTVQRFGNSYAAERLVLAAIGRRGRAGTTVMRRVMAERDADHVPTESELEDLFVSFCDGFGLPVPRRQVVLGGDQLIGRVDFVFADAKVVVEVDGGIFHDSPTDRVNDAWRDLELEAAGWTVVRLRWRQLVDDPDRVARLLKRRLGLAA